MSLSPPTPLGHGAEFDIIRRILEGAAPAGAQVALGAGDDCALIGSADGYVALSVDLSVEGVHFMREWGTPDLIGARAVRAAVSDLAAMAAQPMVALVALSVPDDEGAELAEELGSSCRRAAESLGLSLVGGDLSRGGQTLVIDVAVVGSVATPLLRSGARPGDELWVTGSLGGAAAAVRAWKAGREVDEAWTRSFWLPNPRVGEARWLLERGASAGIDISDGLIADAGHIAAASGVGVELELGVVPAAPGIDARAALSGGEDYELLVAAPHGILSAEAVSEFRQHFATPLTNVGRVVAGSGVRLYGDGEEVQISALGYDHFS